jgi:putative transposase
LIEVNHSLSIEAQCQLLGKTRSWYYYTPTLDEQRLATDNLHLEAIAEIHQAYPFYGYRKIEQELQRQGWTVGAKRVYRLMREAGICAIYPGPNLSKARQNHQKYPYLLRYLQIVRPNQVWQMDISYIKLATGICYLTAVIDVFSRKVLSWQVSNSMEVTLPLMCLVQAILQYGLPEILNTDQGSQFTSEEFSSYVHEQQIRFSMDGKGRALDNIYVERLWRSVKYEFIFLNSFATLDDLRVGLVGYFSFYNERRVHQSLVYGTPSEIYECCKVEIKHPKQAA